MKVKELINILKSLNPNAIIDISSDEEGNSFGDIDYQLSKGKLIGTKETVYTLYPVNSLLPEEKYFMGEDL